MQDKIRFNKQHVVAIVPMKLNNRRLPQKNTKSFTNGKPLCHYILSTLLTVDKIDEVYVYCSNPDIQEFIPEGVKYLRRSECLDQDTTSMTEVLTCFTKEVDGDVYVLTHTTAPFISKESIEKGLDAVLSGEYDSSFAAKKLQDFLWSEDKPFNYALDNIPRTQDLPALYEETSGFYIYKKEVMSELHRRIGEKSYIVEVGEIEGIDIDEPEDFEIADAVFNYKKLIGGGIAQFNIVVKSTCEIYSVWDIYHSSYDFNSTHDTHYAFSEGYTYNTKEAA